jgi:hypothetical protein
LLEQERKEKNDKANDLDEKSWVDHTKEVQKNLVTGKLRTKAKPVGYVASDLAKMPMTGVKPRLTILDDWGSPISDMSEAARKYYEHFLGQHKKDMEDFIIGRYTIEESTPVKVPRVRHETSSLAVAMKNMEALRELEREEQKSFNWSEYLTQRGYTSFK